VTLREELAPLMAATTLPRYDLIGGRLCLDFCNTTGDRSACAGERLESYADVVQWGRRAGILNAEEAARLTRLGARNPTEALVVWERTIRLREALYAIFCAVAEGRRIRPMQLEVL